MVFLQRFGSAAEPDRSKEGRHNPAIAMIAAPRQLATRLAAGDFGCHEEKGLMQTFPGARRPDSF